MSKIKRLLPENIVVLGTLEPDTDDDDLEITSTVYDIWNLSIKLLNDKSSTILSSDELDELKSTVNAINEIIEYNERPF